MDAVAVDVAVVEKKEVEARSVDMAREDAAPFARPRVEMYVVER